MSEERRKYPRAGRMGLIVRFEHETYEVSNWSMGGFLVDDYQGQLSSGALVTVIGLGCKKTEIYDVNLPARVIRSDDQTIAINYLGLDANAYDFLTNALSICGQMRSLV
ncbi:MAG: hypothetical protein JKY27_08975 [Magnetovibrio sp.]|nr:hypothetical protein [Magnetovibrio sp.]